MSTAYDTICTLTKEDPALHTCVKKLHQQGVTYEELKNVIPYMKQAKNQLLFKKVVESNNQRLVSLMTREVGYLLDAKERMEEEQFRKLDQLIRQQQAYRKEVSTQPLLRLFKKYS